MIRADKIISEFSLKPFGAKGWMKNDKLACPSCGRGGKFGFKISDVGGRVHCFICDYSANIYKYLKSTGRSDLISTDREYSAKAPIKFNFSRFSDEESGEDILPEVEMPFGCKNILHDDYLNKKGFTENDYKLFEPCITDSVIERKLNNYLIFKIKQEGRLVAWLARSKHSYDWHEENLRKHKENGDILQLRYRNSEGTDFNKILGGYDEINDNTDTVILVEGMFDRVGVNNKLMLDRQDGVKCCFTFGNKVSDAQISLLRNRKNLKNIVLLYDYGTVKQSKAYGMKLSKFFSTFVCLIEDSKVDPGDMPLPYLLKVLENKKSAINFYVSQIG